MILYNIFYSGQLKICITGFGIKATHSGALYALGYICQIDMALNFLKEKRSDAF